MNAPIPGLVETSRPGRRVVITEHPKVRGPGVAVKSDQLDAGNTAIRTTLLRPGYVLVKVTATGKYVAASDSAGDRNTPAQVTALVTNPGAGGWDGDLVIKGHWGTITVALAGDNTNAAVAAAIIAAVAAQNPETKARITAVDTGTRVRVDNLDVGAESYLQVRHTTVTTAFGAAGTGAIGGEADYLVSEDYVDMLNGNAVATEGQARTLRAGNFDGTKLINCTAEALGVLNRRGSIVEGAVTLVGNG